MYLTVLSAATLNTGPSHPGTTVGNITQRTHDGASHSKMLPQIYAVTLCYAELELGIGRNTFN